MYFLASDYASNCCSGPDENCNNSTSHSNANLSGSCGEVYVWGSNCTHQLAEGGQEKITTPKYSAVFTDCQQVSADHFPKSRVSDLHLSSQTLDWFSYKECRLMLVPSIYKSTNIHRGDLESNQNEFLSNQVFVRGEADIHVHILLIFCQIKLWLHSLYLLFSEVFHNERLVIGFLKKIQLIFHKHMFINCFCKLIDIFKHVYNIDDFCLIL